MIGYHQDPEDNFRFSKDGLALILSDAGFEIVESGFYGNLGMTLSEMIRFTYFHPYTMKQTRWRKRIVFWVERFFKLLDGTLLKSNSVFANAYVIARK